MGHPMRIEFILVGLLVKLANHYTTQGAHTQGVGSKSYTGNIVLLVLLWYKTFILLL